MSWTDDRAARAKKLWLEGRSATQIAAELGGGLSRNAVIGKLTRMGLTRHGASHPVEARKPSPSKPSAPKARPVRPIPLPASTAHGWRSSSASETKAPDLATIRKVETTDRDPATLKTFAEKAVGECSWPIGTPDPVRGQLFCGQPTPFRKSYCEGHSPSLSRALKTVRWKDETRPARLLSPLESDIDLVEAFR